jgi:hypothetical protein
MRRQPSSTGLQSPPFVALQATTANTLSGWLSRSWLSSLVLPGETASQLLMGTVLENDDSSPPKIGDTAYLCGGFVLCGRAWWSKASIVGRVFAASRNSTDCMGWIGIPDVMPISATSKKCLPDG